MKTTRAKTKTLAPIPAKALRLAREAIKPMCDLFRMVPQEDWSPASLGTDGEMRRRFFEAEEYLKLMEAQWADPSASPVRPGHKPLFAENERMKLGERGYSKDDVEKIRNIATRLVEGRVLKGEVNPDNDEELKKAIKQAGRDALQAFNAALEFLSG